MRLRSSPLLLLAVLLAACSPTPVGTQADGVPTAPPAEGAARFVGNDALQWEQPDKQVALPPSGELTLEIVCDGNIAHNIIIEDVQDEEVLVDCTGGRTGTATVALPPGDHYYYWCAIPGHLAAGMDGNLSVAAG